MGPGDQKHHQRISAFPVLYNLMRLPPLAAGKPLRTRSAGPQPRPARHLLPSARVPALRPAPAPRPRPAVPPSGVTGAPAPAAPAASAAELSAGGRAGGERAASGARSPSGPGARARPPGEAAFPPARRPQRDRDAAARSGAGAREGPGAAAGGFPPPAPAVLEPRLAVLLGARRLPGGLGWRPALLQPPASSLPGGEPHLVLHLELAGEGDEGSEDKG